MKTYEKTAESILRHRTEYKLKKKRRNRVIASVLAVCIAAGAGTGFYLTPKYSGKIKETDASLSQSSEFSAEADPPQNSADTASDSVSSEIGEITNQRLTSEASMAYILLRRHGHDYKLWDRTEEKFADEYIGRTVHGYGTENSSGDTNGGRFNADEFSCDVGGEIYTVKGFDPEFALCIKSDVNGKYYAFCNLDIEIKTGADLLGEKAYNLKSNLAEAEYQSHSDWDIGVMIYRPLDGIEKEDFENLVDCICSSAVINPDISYAEILTDVNLKTQRHIILSMSDEWPFRTITIRLYEGGYVWIESLCEPGVLFRVSDPVFDKIYNAAKDISATPLEMKASGVDPYTIGE